MPSIAPPNHTRGTKTTDSWITPRWILERFGPFDLDPCACDPMPWPSAHRMITEKEDGLSIPWNGLAWCNPPYGKALAIWLKRMADHNNGIALIFARTDTKAFQEWVFPKASGILFLRGGLTFHKPDGSLPDGGFNSGGPSCLVAYGPTALDRLKSARELGAFLQTSP